MTVGALIVPALYDGDGVTVQFLAPWEVRDTDWIEAGWADTNAVWQPKINGADYTVSKIGASWYVTFNAAPPAGTNNVAIARRTPGLQQVAFKDLRRFPAENTEAMGDLLAEASQDLAAQLLTAFRLAPPDYGKLAVMDPLTGAVGKFWTIIADPGNPGGYKVSFSPSVAAVEATAAIAEQILVLAGISAEIVIVAQPAAAQNIALVAPSIGNVNIVGGAIANVNIVAGSIANVNIVAGSIGNVNTVAGSIANVNTTAANIANVNLVGADLALGAGLSFILRAPQAAVDAIAARDVAIAYTAAEVDEPVEGFAGDKFIFNPQTDLDVVTNVITKIAHGLRNGQAFTYRDGGGTAPAPAVDDTQYWAEVLTVDTFKMKVTRYGSALDFTDTGAGTAHEIFPIRSALHEAAYAETDAFRAEAAAFSAEDAAALVASKVISGTYANAAAVVAAFPDLDPPYLFELSTGEIHVLSSKSPPTSAELQVLAKSNTAENQAGVDDVKFVTPKGAREVVQSTPQSKVAMPPVAALAPDAAAGDLVSFSDAGAAAETANEYKKAGVFFHTGDRLKKVWHAGFADVAEHFGAVGDNVQDNLQNFLDAWTAAKAAGHKTIYIPPARGAGFLLSGSMFTIDVDEAMVVGVGRASILRFTNDGAGLRIDCSGAASRQRIHLRNFHMVNDHATGAASVGVDIVTDVAKLQGLLHSRFEGMWFRRFGLANVRFGDTAAEASGVGSHSFCEIINQKDPNTDRYPDYSIYCVKRGGSTINIVGGMLRAKNATEAGGDTTKGYCVKAGANEAGVGFGDMNISNVQFTRGRAGAFIEGAPLPGTDEYRSGFSIQACDFDGLDTYLYRLHRLDSPRILAISNQVGVGAEIVDCAIDRAMLTDRDEVTFYGHKFKGTETRGRSPDYGLQLRAFDTGAPRIEPVRHNAAASANAQLDLHGLGTGGVDVGHNQANYLRISGAADGSPATITVLGDNDANAGLNLNMKGDGRLALCIQSTELLSFFNAAGVGRQTLNADSFGNPLVEQIADFLGLTKHGLWTDSHVTAQATRLLVDLKLGANYTIAASNTYEVVLSAAGVVIPVTGAYLVSAAMNIRHNDSAASDYSMRVRQGTTNLDVHAFTSIKSTGVNEDRQLHCSKVLWLTAGTFTYELGVVQNPRTTVGGIVAQEAAANKATFLQIARL